MRQQTMRVWVILGLLLLSAPAAWARLAMVGPISGDNGFPLYYVDTNGVAVWLPPPSLGGPFGTPVGKGGVVTPPSMIFFPATTTNPFSVQIGWDQEFFYWSCTDAGKLTTPFGKFTFQLSLEASFNVLPIPNATDGKQTVFSRLRCTLKSTTLPQGTYTLSHPYGTLGMVNSGAGLNVTQDIPLGTQLDFNKALNSGNMGPFLTQLSPAPVITPGTPPPYDTGWLGDGVTACTITGSPIGFNQIRLDGPAGSGIGGPGIDFIQTDQFIVSGHRYPFPIPTPETVNRVTYTRNRIITYFDAFATSVTGASVFGRVGGAPPIAMPEGAGVFAGLFHVRAHYFNSATRSMCENPTNPLAPVAVTSRFTSALAPTTITQTPVDQVMITQAAWSAATQQLTVTAKSSDSVLRSPLNLVNPSLGALVNGTGTFACSIAPATVTVGSSAGGVATKAVQILP